MKSLCRVLIVAALAMFAGCGDSGTPGGPGAKKDGKDAKPGVLGPAEETFTIDVPLLTTRVRQGESDTVDISLNRGRDFDEDVTLSFDNLPKGVTIDPASPKIKASDKKVTITVKAAPDAALGEFSINVLARPSKGNDAKNKLKITVAEKEKAKA
jgi:uncharacterized membrane protein